MMMVVRVLAGVIVVVGAIGIGFLVAMRAKFAPVQSAVRKMNRNVMNPMTMRDAGQLGSSTSIVRHRGRTSGTEYETPVGAYLVDDAIYIALPYGPNTDWCKNLEAAGGGEMVHDGATLTLGPPEVLAIADSWDVIPQKDQRTLKTFKVDEVLRLPVVAPQD